MGCGGLTPPSVSVLVPSSHFCRLPANHQWRALGMASKVELHGPCGEPDRGRTGAVDAYQDVGEVCHRMVLSL